MPVQGPLQVKGGESFPSELGVAGGVTALDDFDTSTREDWSVQPRIADSLRRMSLAEPERRSVDQGAA